MTIDEQLEKLAERHEALAQSVELIYRGLEEEAAQNREKFRALAAAARKRDRLIQILLANARQDGEDIQTLLDAVRQDGENILALARIAEIRQRHRGTPAEPESGA